MILKFIIGFISVYFFCILVDLLYSKLGHTRIIWKYEFINMANVFYSILCGICIALNYQPSQHVIIFLILAILIALSGCKINKIIWKE